MKRWLNSGLVILITIITLFTMAKVRSAGVSNSYGAVTLADTTAANADGVTADVYADVETKAEAEAKTKAEVEAKTNAQTKTNTNTQTQTKTPEGAGEMDPVDNSKKVQQSGQADEHVNQQVNQQMNQQDEEFYGRFLFDDN